MSQSKTNNKAPEPTSSTFDPTAALQTMFSQMQQFWGQNLDEQRQRAGDHLDEFARLHNDGARRSQEAADEMSELVKASFDYSRKLGQQWTTMGIEASRRALGMVAPSA